MAAADQWNADHVRTIAEYKKPITVVAKSEKVAELQEV
jgi:hypothetical protein